MFSKNLTKCTKKPDIAWPALAPISRTTRLSKRSLWKFFK